MKQKQRLTALFPLLMIAIPIIFREEASVGARHGLEVWAKVLVPTLFPFSVAATLLVKTGSLERLSQKLSAFTAKTGLYGNTLGCILTGLVAGYPIGAVTAESLYRDGTCSSEECEEIVILSAFCSPMFVLGVAGELVGGNSGTVILISHYLAELIAGIIYVLTKKKRTSTQTQRTVRQQDSFGVMLSQSIANGARSIINVGGYTVIFSIIVSLLPDAVKPFLSVFLELSSGIECISTAGLSSLLTVALASFCITWGGLSVVMQINGFAEACNVSGTKVAAFRFLSGATAGMLSVLISSTM